MSSFVLTPTVRRDVLAIADYIAQDSTDAALDVLDDLDQAFHLLAKRPGIGHLRDDLVDEPSQF